MPKVCQGFEGECGQELKIGNVCGLCYKCLGKKHNRKRHPTPEAMLPAGIRRDHTPDGRFAKSKTQGMCRNGHIREVTKDGKCRVCASAGQARYRQRHRDKVRAYLKQYRDSRPGFNSRVRLKSVYGLPPDAKQKMFDAQGGKCANGGCPYLFKSLSDANLDHNHKTGQIRELLCAKCNRAYGELKENSDTISGLLNYHNKWETKCQSKR